MNGNFGDVESEGVNNKLVSLCLRGERTKSERRKLNPSAERPVGGVGGVTAGEFPRETLQL
jgi:hypothetical protein